MAITSITINFTPCPDPPVGGYNIEYRVVGDVSYIDGGSFVSSPANIPVSYPDGTEFEGIVHSPCGDVVWSTAAAPDEGCGCRFAYPGEDDTGYENRLFTINDDFNLAISGAVDGLNNLFQVTNNSTGRAIEGISSNGIGVVGTSDIIGVLGRSTNGAGIWATSTNANALYVQSDNALPIFAITQPASTNTVVPIVQLMRSSSGAGADGIGGSIELYTKDDSGDDLSNRIIWKWSDAAIADRVSEFSITGIDAAVESTLFTLAGNGQARLNKYGIGTFADDPVFGLGVLADGTIVEYDPAGGSGGGGGSTMRFGYTGEDDTAGEDRVFDVGALYQVIIQGGYGTEVHDSIFKVVNSGDNGVAVFAQATGAGATGLIAQGTDVGVSITGTNVLGASITSTDGVGALIASTNNKGAQISTDSGDYSLEARTASTVSNDIVLPNLLLKAFSTIIPVADGFGQSIDFQTNTTDFPTVRIASRIISRWTIADDATGESELIIAGVQAGALNDLLYISGTGIFTLPLGLTEYANDAAAAAGTPVIPIGGLYRTGNAVQIRLI